MSPNNSVPLPAAPVLAAVAAAATPPASKVNPGAGCLCGICGEAISEADRKEVVAKKLATGFCLTDSYALRSFIQCCKSQKTESQMDQLKVTNPELWKQTVIAFRDQRQKGSKTKFDIMKHLETYKKSLIQDLDDVYRPLLFSEYCNHYMQLPEPLTLTKPQCYAQWHRDLKDDKVRKSTKTYWNPQSNQHEAAWFRIV